MAAGCWPPCSRAYCRVGPSRWRSELGLLSQHGDPSRMALFTSKRFANTRACQDHFPTFKGKYSHISHLKCQSAVISSSFGYRSFFIFFNRHEKALVDFLRGVEMFTVNIVASCSPVEWRRRHTPPLIQNFGAAIFRRFFPPPTISLRFSVQMDTDPAM